MNTEPDLTGRLTAIERRYLALLVARFGVVLGLSLLVAGAEFGWGLEFLVGYVLLVSGLAATIYLAFRRGEALLATIALTILTLPLALLLALQGDFEVLGGPAWIHRHRKERASAPSNDADAGTAALASEVGRWTEVG